MLEDPLSITDMDVLADRARRHNLGFEEDRKLILEVLADTPWDGHATLMPRMRRDIATVVGPPLADVLPRLVSGLGISNVAHAFASAAGTPWARELLDQFERTRDARARWSLGSAVSQMSPAKLAPVAEQVIRILRTEEWGRSREMLGLIVGRIGTPETTALALELLDHPVLGGHTLSGLARAKTAMPREKVEPFLTDVRPDVRRVARRVLERMDA